MPEVGSRCGSRRRWLAWAVGAATSATALLGGAGHSAAGDDPVDRPTKTDQLARWAHEIADGPLDRVAVELLPAPGLPDPEAAIGRAVREAGGRVTGGVPGFVVQADVPAASLDALADAPGVLAVRRPLSQAIRPDGIDAFVQAVTGDEVAHTNAAAWHAAGHTGAGIKVGIVDGFDVDALDEAIAGGDLPPIDTSHSFCRFAGSACALGSAGSRHGVAVAEIVHELAPDAELYLAEALTASDLQDAVTWFVANGVTVVNRSLGASLDGPGDGTRSALGAIADQAVASGIAWFNSAGNEAGRDGRQGNYYRAPFTDADGDGWHEFVNPAGDVPAGGPYEDLAMACEGQVWSSLRWSDWADVPNATDYDLFVFSEPGGAKYVAEYNTNEALDDPALVDASAASQGPGQGAGAPPLEHFNGGSCQSGDTVYVAIRRYADHNGSADDTLELMAEADLESWSNPYSAGYPIVDSPNPGVFAIGAVDADHSVAFYSSEGPTNDGRIKPDFTARSGVATIGIPSFHGTSASSPTAAGLAAIVQSAGLASSPAALRDWFVAHAAADGGPCGPDTVYGSGELVLPDPEATSGSANPYLACASRYVPLAPTRVFDSRPDEAAPGPKGKLPAEGSVDVQVAGVGGVPASATAVVLNVTVTDTEAAGHVTVAPSGRALPLASAVNVVAADQTRAALVTVPVGTAGRVTLFTKSAAHLIVDVAGYYADVAGQPTTDGRFVAITPQRLFDTRPTEPSPGPKGAIGARQQLVVTATGVGGVPEAGVAAVVINLTGTDAAAAGYLAAFPTGTAVPPTSTVNLEAAGATAPNLAIVPLGADGRISIYSSHGTHALADVVGYITDASAPLATTGLFVALTPTRVLDTRPGTPAPGPKAYVAAGQTITAQIGGNAGVPLQASAVVLSVTGAQSAPGYLTVWGSGVARPVASSLNFTHLPADTRANGAMARLGDGQISVFSRFGGHVIADVTGYYLW